MQLCCYFCVAEELLHGVGLSNDRRVSFPDPGAVRAVALGSLGYRYRLKEEHFLTGQTRSSRVCCFLKGAAQEDQ